MSIENTLEQQANEFKKLSYDLLLGIAKSGDPLTYTVEVNEGTCQVEISFDSFSDTKLEMVVGIDADRKSDFDKKSYTKIFDISRQ